MNFGITNSNNYVHLYKTVDGLDYSAIKETSAEILSRAQKTDNTLNQIDLSKFTRADNGLNLYDGSLNSDATINLSLQNSGHGINLNNDTLASIKYLNTQAAGDVISKNLDGKIVPMNENTVANVQNTSQTQKISETSKINSIEHENGNPFSAGMNGSGMQNK